MTHCLKVASGEQDMGIAQFTVQRDRLKLFDFTPCFTEVQFVYQTALPGEITRYDTLLIPFDYLTWVCLLLTSVTIEFVLLLADKLFHRKLKGQTKTFSPQQ